MSDVLIVIDMQNDFINGVLGSAEAAAIVPAVAKKIHLAIDWDDKVIFTMDTHNTIDSYNNSLEGIHIPPHCIRNTEGWMLHKDLPFDDRYCKIITKNTFGYTWWTHELAEVDDIEICGLCTDICVINNALILRNLFPNKHIYIDAKCCAGTSPEKHQAAIEIMRSNLITIF